MGSAEKPSYRSLRRIWRRLTAPNDSLTDPVDQNRAQLLAAVMLVFILLNLPIFAFAEIDFYRQGTLFWTKPIFFVWLSVIVLAFVVYGLSRSKHFQFGALLFSSWLVLLMKTDDSRSKVSTPSGFGYSIRGALSASVNVSLSGCEWWRVQGALPRMT